MPHILVLDGNRADIRDVQRQKLGYDSGLGYANVLRRLDPAIRADIVCPADSEVVLPMGVSLRDYDGAVITGSALNIYNRDDSVERQIRLTADIFEAGVPLFGSCWGLQVAVTVAGGRVQKNPHGREFGFARRILLSEEGRSHPLYEGKPPVFEAPTIHLDAVCELPQDASVLATSEMGIQAVSFSYRRSTFWGVQYHPEYDPIDLAAVAERYGQRLIDEGLFPDEPSLKAFVSDLHKLQKDPTHRALAWRHGLGPGITSESVRLAELRNWLAHQVIPRARARG
jgi:GMP synthase (glutamine-hydrolysing)